jgi:hypothetical protein
MPLRLLRAPAPPATRAHSGPCPSSHLSAPRHVSPSQWLRANRLPSVRGHCVCARSYPLAPSNLYLRPTSVRPQSRTREESAPDSMRPRLESVPFPTSLRPTRMRPHPRSREESAPGPTRPRLFPPVRARSHPPAPISMRSRPTRSRFYQRAHMANRAGD